MDIFVDYQHPMYASNLNTVLYDWKKAKSLHTFQKNSLDPTLNKAYHTSLNFSPEKNGGKKSINK